MHRITWDELNFGPLNITIDLMVRYRYIERYSGFNPLDSWLLGRRAVFNIFAIKFLNVQNQNEGQPIIYERVHVIFIPSLFERARVLNSH